MTDRRRAAPKPRDCAAKTNEPVQQDCSGATSERTIADVGRTALWIAGVVRDTDGVPVRLGDPVQLATIAQTGRGLAWVDDLSIGVLSGDDTTSTVLEQVVGGISTTSATGAGMRSIAGGTGLSSARLRGEDGTLYVKRGTSWQPTATGTALLATQQGTPQ